MDPGQATGEARRSTPETREPGGRLSSSGPWLLLVSLGGRGEGGARTTVALRWGQALDKQRHALSTARGRGQGERRPAFPGIKRERRLLLLKGREYRRATPQGRRPRPANKGFGKLCGEGREGDRRGKAGSLGGARENSLGGRAGSGPDAAARGQAGNPRRGPSDCRPHCRAGNGGPSGFLRGGGPQHSTPGPRGPPQGEWLSRARQVRPQGGERGEGRAEQKLLFL